MKATIVEHKTVSGGQVRPYGDSRTVIHMTTTPCSADEAWEASQSIHGVTIREQNGRQFNGSCGFPHGLNSFGNVKKLSEDGTQWEVVLIWPYCD